MGLAVISDNSIYHETRKFYYKTSTQVLFLSNADDMLVLSSITALLNQLLSPPNLHTAVLLTPQGQLVAYATTPPMSEDRVRLVVGLGGEVWKEIVESEEEEDLGMVDSEVSFSVTTSPLRRTLMTLLLQGWARFCPSDIRFSCAGRERLSGRFPVSCAAPPRRLTWHP
jgi:hypothetical protein